MSPGHRNGHQPIRFERRRRYPISPAEAWRLLADTEHMNRSIGLPPVDFSPSPDPLLREAEAKVFGFVPVRWKEFPFDWVRERRYAVRREFENGPIARVVGGIELTPEDGGVTVNAFAEFVPANSAGRVLWRVGRAPVNEILDFCDQYLARKTAGQIDPVPSPPGQAEVNLGRLETLIQRLRRDPVRQELIAPLRERILGGSDDQLVRIRPFAVADAWGADRTEVLRLFLYATRAGLFELRWELMCPNCRIPKDEVASLSRLPTQFHCETCAISYDTDFDQSVELRFSIHSAVRAASDVVYCIGSPLRMPHIFAQQYLRPAEQRTLQLGLREPVRLRTVGSQDRLTVMPAAADDRVSAVEITYADGRWVGPRDLTQGDGVRLPEGSPVVLRNQSGGSVLAILSDLGWSRDATTAAHVTTLQEFRDLFSSEVLAPGQQLAVNHVALVFSDLKGSTRLYEGIGDAAAYSRVNRHFDFIREAVLRFEGSIIKTLGDGVMCAFHTLDDALDAAIAMQQHVASWCREQSIDPPLVLKLGVHAGPVIAVTANDRLDYFGRTVNLAARLGDQSRGQDIVLLREVFEQAPPQAIGDGLSIEAFSTRIRGLNEASDLIRLTVT